MRSALYYNNTLSKIYIVLSHWYSSPWVDMLLHSDPLFWLRANQYLLLLINTACLAGKQQIPNFIVFVWPNLGSNPRSTAFEASLLTITPPMHFDRSIALCVINVLSGLPYCVINLSPDLTHGGINAVTACHSLYHKLSHGLTLGVINAASGHTQSDITASGLKMIMLCHQWFHSLIIYSHSKCQTCITWSHTGCHKLLNWSHS